MIKIDSITKNFDTVRSLDDVSVCIDTGSIFGLIGSNGSGKSTLLRVMCGIYRSDSGSVTYDGCTVWENVDVKKDILYLSDNQYFLPGATTRDMMDFYRTVYPSFSIEKYKTYLSLFGLDENRRLSTFSKGMQKQVSFLIGLSCGTRYLFCDETLDGLDPVMRQTVRKIIAAEVAERGLTVVFASHNLKEIEDICDHVSMLHNGKLLFEAGIDDIKTGIHKIQITSQRETADAMEVSLKNLDRASVERRSSIFTVLARGEEAEIAKQIEEMNPLFYEFIPLTLEEIFIAEMEDKGYEFDTSIIG